jgi:hypothetical protein
MTMTSQAGKHIQPLDIVTGERKELRRLLDAESNTVLWKRPCTDELQNYCSWIADDRACEAYCAEVLRARAPILHYKDVGLRDHKRYIKSCVRTFNGQKLTFNIDALGLGQKWPILLADAQSVLNEIVVAMDEPVVFYDFDGSHLRFYCDVESKALGYYGLARSGENFHQDWIVRNPGRHRKGFTCIVNYVGPVTEVISASAYQDVFCIYQQLLYRVGSQAMQAAFERYIAEGGVESKIVGAPSHFDVLLYATNCPANDDSTEIYEPVACIHRVPKLNGKRLTLIVHGAVLNR